MRPGAGLALVAVAVVAAATACGSGGDKAGGRAGGGPPLVLTLESLDDPQLSGAPELAAAVARLSGGSMRIRIVPAGQGPVIPEQGVVHDVRAGRTQLGLVPVRVWDTLGVPSFRALLAPLLVDSLELEMRVLASPASGRMLEGVERAGVVGIALLPGPLRLPYGLARAFVGPGDYRGATLGIVPSRLAATSFRALGAGSRAYPPGHLSGLDGAELDPTTIVYNGYDERRGWLTTNVVLWPKPYSLVMNRRAFASLTSDQQKLLRSAGREAAEPERRQVEHDASVALQRACRAAKLTFAEATPRQLAALRRAVQPVYDQLARDPGAGRALREIHAMRRSASHSTAGEPRCREAAPRVEPTSALEGTWKVARATKQELLDAGVDPKNAEALSRLPGTPAFVFEDGRFEGIDLETGRVLATGTYEIDGDVVHLVFETGVAVQFGRMYSLRWSVYRDSLTFNAIPGSEPLIGLVLRPFTRVR